MRDKYRVLLGVGRSHVAGLAHKNLEDALDDLDDIGLALA